MKYHLLLSSVCTAGLIGSLPALAQQSSSSSASQPGSSTAQTSSDSGSGQYLRVSQLIGSTAKAKDGQNLGQIEDVVVDAKAQHLKFAVLGKGGFLGIGEKMVPVPWKAMSVEQTDTGASGKPNLTVNIDRQKLQSAPTLHKDKQYSELDQPDYTITVYRFYEIEPVGAGSPSEGAQTQSGSQQNPDSSQQQNDSSQQK
jgi:sporulation protein YlmC with PRC-barrel domain